MKNGAISGNTSSGNGSGVYVSGYGTFNKTGGGFIYGYNSAAPDDEVSNKALDGDTWGHAVYYNKDASNIYYRDASLGPTAADNISTSTVPSTAGEANALGNWIKK
jgi:hypothetical protein